MSKNTKYHDSIKTLFDAISLVVKNAVENSPHDITRNGRILKIKGMSYEVLVDGNVYNMYATIPNLIIGDTVKVMIPDGQMSQAFIYGRLIKTPSDIR